MLLGVRTIDDEGVKERIKHLGLMPLMERDLQTIPSRSRLIKSLVFFGLAIGLTAFNVMDIVVAFLLCVIALISIKVLIERIRVQLRKKANTTDESKNLIVHGKLKLDPSQLECEWDGKSLPEKLTTTEFLIVKELAKRPGVIKERAHLMDML